jgi:enamine deaminase RidA (YjgF/YER057c/UK114 family)
MKKECINPSSLFDSRQYGFSQIVSVRPERLVFISGQVAWDNYQQIVGKNNLRRQTEKSMENLKIAIESTGGSLEDIVMLRIYKVKYQSADGQIISEVLKNYFGTQNPPSSTWINVIGLANEEFMIEIEAQAVL